MAYTADVNRWRGPAPEGEAYRYERPRMLESPWHPGWIAVTVLGFIIWWPIGLALLFFTLGSRKMGCFSRHDSDRWANKMERMQYKMDRMRGRMEGRGWGFGPPSSGNRAFDEYRTETLRRLEEEQQPGIGNDDDEPAVKARSKYSHGLNPSAARRHLQRRKPRLPDRR